MLWLTGGEVTEDVFQHTRLIISILWLKGLVKLKSQAFSKT